MRIKTKLFLGFGTLMILMFALAGIGINRLTTIDHSINEIFNNRYTKVQISTVLRNDTAELAKYLANLLLNEDPESTNKIMESIRLSSAKVMKSMEQIHNEYKGSNEQPLAVDLLKKGNKFLEYKDQVLGLYLANNKNQAMDLRTAVGLTYEQEMLDSISATGQYQSDALMLAMEGTKAENRRTYTYTGMITILSLLLGVAIMFWIVLAVTRGLSMLSGIISNFGNEQARGSYRVSVKTTDEFGDIAHIFNAIAEDLEDTTTNERALSKVNADQAWLQMHIAEVSTQLQDTQRLEEATDKFIQALCRIIGAQSGAMYMVEQEGRQQVINLKATYARPEQNALEQLLPGQGLIGQCIRDGNPITLTDISNDYFKISAAFGTIPAASLAVRPIVYMDEVIAAYEIAAVKPLTDLELQLLDHLNEVTAITIHRIKGQLRVEELLRISQMLTDELQSQSMELLSQQEELQASNGKLEEQTTALLCSEKQLQQQQSDLEHTNNELRNKTMLLQEQIKETEEINREIEHAKDTLEKQARELAFASKYKSEFMANMSHELRTPLNSLLILSQLLKENKEGNLSERQVEYAETILSSGTDLLRLIDDVLDLAKVESGRMDLHYDNVRLCELKETMMKAFMPIARKKKVEFEFEIDPQTPETMYTDSLRLLQILKNLLSNAFKFTTKGSVKVQLAPVVHHPSMLAFSVTDTGIGIAKEKSRMIFEAFQQADGTTSRKYGGTGLGLSISTQLATLLGGHIELDSQEGVGSQFILYVPHHAIPGRETDSREVAAAAEQDALATKEDKAFEASILSMPLPAPDLDKPLLLIEQRQQEPVQEAPAIHDDRDSIREGNRVLLIVEDDISFVRILVDMARERGFKTIIGLDGVTGLRLAKQYKPDAILLDIQLPIVDGWSILVQLKNDTEIRHIPVHVISVVDEVQQGLAMGAIAYLQKPSAKDSLEEAFSQIEAFLEKGTKKLLIVSQDTAQRNYMVELIGYDDVHIVAADGSHEAWMHLQKESFDCMVIDMGPRDLKEFELLDQIKSDPSLRRLPIVIYSNQVWEQKEKLRLKKYGESIIIKDVRSPERLLDETSLFLHRVEENLPEEKRQILRKLHSKEEIFAGKRVLLVDDDIRNVFALSNLLEGYKMVVGFAETGKQALDLMKASPAYDIVLMDIMMPEMDGYEAMRMIRSQQQFDSLPIIALTAKAMKNDRDKCIEAGASDYINKPIQTEQLLSLIRVWLCQ
ncbi:response regulator [Paenibacillus sp. S3N08]|uniref:histidine kinase n=1 Tax=Paenibacillus agricola TaxID=2716264 RepID=A0ABX0J2U6_9BACL|nr:response regulator [Paenibacillus agricola]